MTPSPSNARFTRLPAYLAQRARTVRQGISQVPALLAHPDWQQPAPFVIWLHGRTVSKELDPGRYLRWIRAGIAACALDLPGHGERYDERFQSPAGTPDLVAQALPEIDEALHALKQPPYRELFDTRRCAVGGMSAGGMVALRRLCDPHSFVCATVEATTGDLMALYHPDAGRPWIVNHPKEKVARVNPAAHLESWKPIPLLAIHSEADRLVPWQTQKRFLSELADHYRRTGADPNIIETLIWTETGAPEEHMGFGRFSNEAKNAQTAFLARYLHPESPTVDNGS